MSEIISKPNEKVAAIRLNMTKEPKPPVYYNTSEATQIRALAFIKSKNTATAKEISEGIGCPKGTLNKVVSDLLYHGCIFDTGRKEGKATIYQYCCNPLNWNLEAPIDIVRKPRKIIRDARDNALTAALNKIDPVVIKTDGYRQFIKDTSKLYGIQELDDIVKDVHDLCIARITKAAKCPICNHQLSFIGTSCGCDVCNISLDLGDAGKSADVFHKMCKEILGAVE